MIKIKKQYKQSDGTVIEVEGTESEIEAFEKKQQKQKAHNEAEQKNKKTILYGKELEDTMRKVVQEELAKIPFYTINVPAPLAPSPNPIWVSPIYNPVYPIITYGNASELPGWACNGAGITYSTETFNTNILGN